MLKMKMRWFGGDFKELNTAYPAQEMIKIELKIQSGGRDGKNE